MKGLRWLCARSAAVRAGRGLLVAALWLGGYSAAGADGYVLTVVPRLSAQATHHDWAPFAERLARELRTPIRLKLHRNFIEFENDVRQGRADLVYMNPYHQMLFHQAPGYVPLVRDGAQPLRGVLVVRKDAPIKTLADLRDKEIGFSHPNAFAASLYLRALLTQREQLRFTPRYLTTHTNVYRHVLLGEVAGGGGVSTTLAKEPAEVRARLRVLYTTPGVASHPLSAHPRVPPATRAAVVRAVLHMARDADGRRLLEAVGLSKPVAADYARDYAPLERLRLERFYVRAPAEHR